MIPSVKPRELIKILRKAGFEASEGSKHTVLSKPGHPNIVTVPRHQRELARPTLLSIIKGCGLTQKQFLDLL